MTTQTETACAHDTYVDYLGSRHLGYCRTCGRTVEYGRDGEKPRDVTAEFGGKSPFTGRESSMQQKTDRWPPCSPKNFIAAGRYYKEHIDEIRHDLDELGFDATRTRWGMSDSWLYANIPGIHRGEIHRREAPPVLPSVTDACAVAAAQVPQTSTDALESLTQVSPEPHGIVRLPPWNEGWNPEVQVEWLRLAASIAVAGMQREKVSQ